MAELLRPFEPATRNRGGSRLFLRRGALLRYDITDGKGKKKLNRIHIYEDEFQSFISGEGAHPLHPPPRSAPENPIPV